MAPKRKADELTSTPLTPLSEEDRNAQIVEQRAYLIGSGGITVDENVTSSPIAKKAKRSKKAASSNTSTAHEAVSETFDIPGDVVAKENATQGIATPAITPETANSPTTAPAVNGLLESAVTAHAQDGTIEKPKKAPRKRKAAASASADALATQAGGEAQTPKPSKKPITRKRKTTAADTDTSLDNDARLTAGATSLETNPPTKRKRAAPKTTPAKKVKDAVLPDDVDKLLSDTSLWLAPPPLTKPVAAKVRTLCDFLDKQGVVSVPRVADQPHLAIVSETEILAALTLLHVHYELSEWDAKLCLDDVAEMIVDRDADGWITLDFDRTCDSEREVQAKLGRHGLGLEDFNLLEIEMEMLAWRKACVAAADEAKGFRSVKWMMGISQDKFDSQWKEEAGDGELRAEWENLETDAAGLAPVEEVS